MSVKQPFFTIAIPVYNRLEYTKEAVESVLRQTFQDFELLLVDDYSDDKAVWDYLVSIKDKRVRVYRNKRNLGIVNNWNQCIKLAKGKWFKFLMNDDIIFRDSLAIIYKSINGNSDVNVLVGEGIIFSNSKKGLENYSNATKLISDNLWSMESVSSELKLRKKFIYACAMPNAYTIKTRKMKKMLLSKSYQTIVKSLGSTGHGVDYFILYKNLLDEKFFIRYKIPLYGIRDHSMNLSKSYSNDVFYHLVGDFFVNNVLFGFNLLVLPYLIVHSQKIFLYKVIQNRSLINLVDSLRGVVKFYLYLIDFLVFRKSYLISRFYE